MLGFESVFVFRPGKEGWGADGEPLEGDAGPRIGDVMRPGGRYDLAENGTVIEHTSTFRPHVPMAEMVDYMRERRLTSVPVTDSRGRLLGTFALEDVERPG